MSAYPEHDKLNTVSAKSQACGEFFDWLMGPQGYALAEYHRHSESCFKDGRKVCGSSTDELYPAPVSIRKLLAEFFKIDEVKLEQEKHAMLTTLNPALPR